MVEHWEPGFWRFQTFQEYRTSSFRPLIVLVRKSHILVLQDSVYLLNLSSGNIKKLSCRTR